MYLDLRNHGTVAPFPETLEDFLKRDFHTEIPFSPLLLDFCKALSQQLTKSDDPDITALGFWLRPAHVSELKERFHACMDNQRIRVPRGLIFHVTASNVDTLFAYSWMLSLLCGNGNFVRLPSVQSSAITTILETIQTVLTTKPFRALDASNCFVHYGHQAEITAKISAKATMRVMWGSNATIQTIREIPLNPYAVEIVFPDRFSYALIHLEHFQKRTPEEKRVLAQAFFRDVYGFDQNGCSSPRLVFWIGKENEFTGQVEAFSNALQNEIESRRYELPLSAFLNKQTQVYIGATELPITSVSMPCNELTTIVLDRFSHLCRHHPGGGLLYHIALKNIDELTQFTNVQDQTVVYEGFDRSTIEALLKKLNGRGPTRFVPIGEALRFSADWDGYDLLHSFTKQSSCS